MNFKKINNNGEYLPFYGYSCIATIANNLDIAEDIENHIKNSSLNRFYSALPLTSFHMTVFNIYSCGGTLIPPVEAWINQNKKPIYCTNALPYQVLNAQNLKANEIIKKHIHEKLLIKNIEFFEHSGILGVLVQLRFQDGLVVQNLRKDLSVIYEHDDISLRSLDKMHITLAYGYRNSNFDDDFNKDLLYLKNLCLKLSNTQLNIPQICKYESMKNYIPVENA